MAEQFQNFFVTKLREACDATATTIYVETVPSITEGTLVLEYANSTKHEIIHFTGVSGYGLTGCTRGLEGTTAQSHSAGTDVRQNLTAGMIDKIINGVITTENIANSAVTTAKINNGAVTADKIDFTTLRTTLWEGRTHSDITDLADNVENYDYIEVYCQWRSASGKTRSTKIYDIAHGAVLFCGGFEDAQNAYFAIQEISFSQKTVSFGAYMQVKNNWGSSGMSASNSTKYIYITRIVGVKCSI